MRFRSRAPLLWSRWQLRWESLELNWGNWAPRALLGTGTGTGVDRNGLARPAPHGRGEATPGVTTNGEPAGGPAPSQSSQSQRGLLLRLLALLVISLVECDL